MAISDASFTSLSLASIIFSRWVLMYFFVYLFLDLPIGPNFLNLSHLMSSTEMMMNWIALKILMIIFLMVMVMVVVLEKWVV